jgi:L-ribulokinase
MRDSFVIGVDFGTDSVRSVVLNAASGAEVASSVFHYPRWGEGLYCKPLLNQFRQHPLDYIEGLEFTIKDCVRQAGSAVASGIRAISCDTTGSTPVAVDERGTPLALLPGFGENPNAMFILWKDHTALKEAAEINALAEEYDVNYLQYVGGIYSSEWFWAKLLHILREDEMIRRNCYSWVEHCDWIPYVLTGGRDIREMKRGVCAAGHKALWSKEFGGLPSNSFFAALDPLLDGFVNRLFNKTYTSDRLAGNLCDEWATRLGLSGQIGIGVGAFDCHMGAVGGEIEPYYLSKVMGTSTCDMLVAPPQDMEGKLVRGICGQVDGSIIPGMIGMEAGQSAFGDTFAWFRDILSWPIENLFQDSDMRNPLNGKDWRQSIRERIIPALSEEAEKLSGVQADELAVDWLNGRRTPDASQELKAGFTGLNLGTSAPAIFRALVEGTCFGARAIAERFMAEGVPVKGLIGLGGVARKSPFIMQTMADVLNMPIKIHRSEQTCAAGAAMFAATAIGLYDRVENAMAAMGQGFEREFRPRPEIAARYSGKYARYKLLGHFIESQVHP